MGSISSSRGVRGGAPGEGRRSSEKQDSAGSGWCSMTHTPTRPPPPTHPPPAPATPRCPPLAPGCAAWTQRSCGRRAGWCARPPCPPTRGAWNIRPHLGGGGVEDRDAGQDRLMLRSDGNSLTVMLSEAGAPLTTQVSVGIRKPVPYSPSLPPTPSHPPRGAHISARCAARATWRRLSRA